jgi:hypothetical protein
VPAVPSCLLEPIWVEFYALLNDARGGEPPRFDPSHPWGCHRQRIPDRVVFEHVIEALVRGSGYERIASAGCSDRTIRRRLTQWARLGLGERLHAVALAAYDLIVGLDLCSLRFGVHVWCRMMDGHVPAVRVSPRRQRVSLDARGPPAGRVEGRRDLAVAAPARGASATAGAQAEADLGRPGADRDVGQCDPKGASGGIAAAGEAGHGVAVAS